MVDNITAIPAQGNTNWYAYAQSLDAGIRLAARGLTPVQVTSLPATLVDGTYYVVMGGTAPTSGQLPASTSKFSIIAVLNGNTAPATNTVAVTTTSPTALNYVAGAGLILSIANEGKWFQGDGNGGWVVISSNYGKAGLNTTYLQLLNRTAIKSAAYTAVASDLALMNVSGGGTTVTLPTAPAHNTVVGARAIGATRSVPLTMSAGSGDTIGLSGATSTTLLFADETLIVQYDAPSKSWTAISNVKPTTSLDANYVLSSNLGAIATRQPIGKIRGISPGFGWQNLANAMTTAQLTADIQRMWDSGVKMIRLNIQWTGGGSTFNRANTNGANDTVIKALVARGIKIIMILGDATSYVGNQQTSGYVTWAGGAASYFAGLGVHDYEILNEPNLSPNWSSGNTVDASPSYYAGILKAVYPVIKAADPLAWVWVGSVASYGKSTGAVQSHNWAVLDWITQLYANGIKGFFDMMNVHPYSYPTFPTTDDGGYNTFAILQSVYSLMVTNGDGNKKIAITEMGVNQANVTQAVQATWVDAVYKWVRQFHFISAVLWYMWSDNANDGNWGIIDSSGTAKAAFTTFTNIGELSEIEAAASQTETQTFSQLPPVGGYLYPQNVVTITPTNFLTIGAAFEGAPITVPAPSNFDAICTQASTIYSAVAVTGNVALYGSLPDGTIDKANGPIAQGTLSFNGIGSAAPIVITFTGGTQFLPAGVYHPIFWLTGTAPTAGALYGVSASAYSFSGTPWSTVQYRTQTATGVTTAPGASTTLTPAQSNPPFMALRRAA